MGAQGFIDEKSSDEVCGDVADDDRVGKSGPLDPGCDGGRLTNDGQFFQGIASPHLSRHHQPGVYAYAHSQLQVFFRLQTGIKRGHVLKYRQPGPHRFLRIVFVGLGVAEVDQESIA